MERFDKQFDQMTQQLAQNSSRRSVIRFLAGGAAVSLLAVLGVAGDPAPGRREPQEATLPARPAAVPQQPMVLLEPDRAGLPQQRHGQRHGLLQPLRRPLRRPWRLLRFQSLQLRDRHLRLGLPSPDGAPSPARVRERRREHSCQPLVSRHVRQGEHHATLRHFDPGRRTHRDHDGERPARRPARRRGGDSGSPTTQDLSLAQAQAVLAAALAAAEEQGTLDGHRRRRRRRQPQGVRPHGRGLARLHRHRGSRRPAPPASSTCRRRRWASCRSRAGRSTGSSTPTAG